MKRTLAAAFCCCLLAGAAIAASPAPLSPAQKQAVRDLIRETLVSDPEILAEAMDALKAKRTEEMRATQSKAIAEHWADIVRKDDPFLGAAKTPAVTAVEFFDYNCGYCRQVFPEILKALKAHPDVRMIIKDLPVLGPDSEAVTRLALAARAQGRYADYHIALMKSDEHMNEATALKIAESLKLDVKKLKADAAGPAVEETMVRNLSLAPALGIRGTPAFIVGKDLIPGAISGEDMARLFAESKKAPAK